MAAQWITIAKIAGSAGDLVLERFRHWDAARVPDRDDATNVDSDQWPHDDRVEADRFVASLADHAENPPVLFYCRYVDLWSMGCEFGTMGDVYLGLMDEMPLQILTASRELYCVDLPSPRALVAACDAQLKHQDLFQESRWYALLVREAVDAWEGISHGGVLLIIREPFGGMVLDNEIEDSLTKLPAWL